MKIIGTFLSLFISLLSIGQNVGVGTATPFAPMHIKSVATAEMLRIESPAPYISFFDGATYSGYLWSNNSQQRMELGSAFSANRSVVIAPDQTASAFFLPNGNVGIGQSPTVGKLDIYSNSLISVPHLALIENGSDFARLTFKNNINTSYWTLAAFNSATNSSERLNFYNSTTGDLMSLTGNGYLGIGTTAPNERLHVNGNLNLTGTLKLNGNTGAAGQVLTSNGLSDPSWTDAAFGNTTRFKFSINDASLASSANLSGFTTQYNINPTDITIGASSITVNKTGLYHIEGYLSTYMVFSAATAYNPRAGLNITVTGTYGNNPVATIELERDQHVSWEIGYRGQASFSSEIYITAGTVVSFFCGVSQPLGSSMTGSSANGTVRGHLISE